MTSEEKAAAALKRLSTRDVPMTAETHLRNDLGLDSGNLVELTVLVHEMYGIDLGRRAVERKVVPVTVGDIARLLES